MSDLNSFGRLMMMIGAILFGVGLFIAFAGKVFPLGRLPGDIFIRKGNFTFYFPVVTSIVLSIVLSLILNFFAKR